MACQEEPLIEPREDRGRIIWDRTPLRFNRDLIGVGHSGCNL